MQSVALVGLSGVGKSTIGRRVAPRLDLEFVDLDQVIVDHAGCPIVDIFAEHGEAGFRDLEAQLLAASLDNGPALIATGGGIVLRQENRDLMRDKLTVVWLRASIETLVPRLTRDSKRPLFAEKDPAATLAEMMKRRDPLYDEVADITIDIDDLDIHHVVICVAELAR